MGVLAALALISLPTAPAVAAGNASRSDQNSNHQTLQLRRADSLLGLDVMSTDGDKVGDIVDFAFHFDGTPAVSHVLVMSGGFLDMGGDVRAVPASDITMTGNSAKLDISTDKFNSAPVLPDNHVDFFADNSRVDRLDNYFGSSSNQGAKENEQAEHPAYTLYTDINANTAIGGNGTDIGRVSDVWVNLAQNEAPLIEIDPSAQVGNRFETHMRQRYEIPASKLEGKTEDGTQYRFQVTQGDLVNVPSANAKDKVTIDYGLFNSGTIIKLNVPEEQNGSQS